MWFPQWLKEIWKRLGDPELGKDLDTIAKNLDRADELTIELKGGPKASDPRIEDL